MRFLLMVAAILVIIGGLGLWLMNHSVAWNMLNREATVRIEDDAVMVQAQVEFRKSFSLVTGFLLNPGLNVESVTVGGKQVAYTRFSSMVVFPSVGLPNEDGKLTMNITARGIPINPPSEGMSPVVELTDDYWLMSPDALWLPANGNPSGRLFLTVDIPEYWQALLPGHLVGRETIGGRECSHWLVPAAQPALLAGPLTTVETRGQTVAKRLPGISLDGEEAKALADRILDGLDYLNDSAGIGETNDAIVLVESRLAGSWSNLHVLQPSWLQNSAEFMRNLGAGKWHEYFRGGSARNWMADSLAGYLSIIYQSEQEDRQLSAMLGELSAGYNIQLKRGYKTNLRDLSSARDDVYQNVGLTKAIFFWHRLRTEMGEQHWADFLTSIQQAGKVVDENTLCTLIAEVSGDKLASVASGWINKNSTPGFYLGAFKMERRTGQNLLQVVVWQSRPFVRGTVLVRAYGPNGEIADKAVYMDVLNAKVEIPTDFEPVSIVIDPGNDWLNLNGSHQLMALSALYSPKDVAVVYSAGEGLSEEQLTLAKSAADALVLHLKQTGMRAVAVADQNATWARVEKANVVLLSPAEATNGLIKADWSVQMPDGGTETRQLLAYSLTNPEKGEQGIWVFEGQLPVTSDQWSTVLSVDAQSVTFGPEYRVQGTVPGQSWLHTDQLYDTVKSK